MPRRRTKALYQHLSEFERGRIIGMCEAGMKRRAVAERVGREPSTVQRVWQQWQAEGTHTRRPGTGPPRRTTEREDRRIHRMAMTTRSATATQIRAAITTSVTPRTICNRLLEVGLRSRVPLQCLPLTRYHRQQRLTFCRARLNWTVEWQRVVFSDESRFCLGQSDRRQRVRRRPGERANPAVIVERHTSPTPGVMVWGAISYDGRSDLVIVQGSMTARQYVDRVINPVVIPFLATIENGIFQQDNARPHTALISREALREVETLEWAARSADLSLIEHVWDMMGRRINANPHPA